ncbi:MAG TPA: ABC transporter ATP-binding protein [Chloroflexia bacterium]|nr:ABC transporter ATP-binding protein [Chloroflexia bacterium]
MTPAIAFDQARKVFPGASRPAVAGASFDVAAGHLVVLLGPSGCGKTTLLKTVNRLYELTAGHIRVEGADVATLPVAALRRRIGYVIQSVGLFPHMRVARNIAVVPHLLGWDAARIRARVDELLDLVGLPPAEYRNRFPAQLSGGQQQRVGLARALAADPPIMLMDEPFAAIDNIARARLQDALLTIQQRVRKTILFVTHDVDEALRLADEIVVMRDGEVLQYDTPLALLTQPVDAFVARLVGADDMIRRLSLIPVQAALESPGSTVPTPGEIALAPGDTLRQALNLLLAQERDRLPVCDAAGALLGTVSLATIRHLTTRPPHQDPHGLSDPAL